MGAGRAQLVVTCLQTRGRMLEAARAIQENTLPMAMVHPVHRRMHLPIFDLLRSQEGGGNVSLVYVTKSANPYATITMSLRNVSFRESFSLPTQG